MAAESFVGVRVQGGLLPAELLSRIAAGAVSGQASADYHLAAGETVREAANRASCQINNSSKQVQFMGSKFNSQKVDQSGSRPVRKSTNQKVDQSGSQPVRKSTSQEDP